MTPTTTRTRARTWVKRGFVALVAALVVAALVIGLPHWTGADKARVVGLFADASTLTVGNLVRAGGVEVGSVRAIGLEDGHARVELEVDRSLLPLHADASMKIRAVNLLGEKYVELDTGTPAAPLVDPGTVVSMDRTSVSVDVQDVINSLGDPAATGLAALVTTAGEGVKDQGKNLAGTIKGFEPSFAQANKLVALLREQNDTLNELVDRVQPVADGLAAGDGAALDKLVGGAQQTLSTVATNKQALDATLAELPATIVSARRTLAELAGTADAATPTLASIRPVTDNLVDISGELNRLADAADPALGSLPPVLEKAEKLLDEAAPAVAQLRQGGPDLKGVAAGARPLGDELLDRNFKGVLDFVKLWAMSTNGKDGLSHYFRGVFIATPQNAGDLANGTLKPHVPLPAPVPRPADTVPGLGRVVPDSPPSQHAPPPATGDPGNATGLSAQQEQSMVSQLLGGR